MTASMDLEAGMSWGGVSVLRCTRVESSSEFCIGGFPQALTHPSYGLVFVHFDFEHGRRSATWGLADRVTTELLAYRVGVLQG